MTDTPTFKESAVLCVYDFALFLIRITPSFLIAPVAKALCFLGRRFVGRDIKILRNNLEQMRDLPKGSEGALEFEKRTFFTTICSALETLKFSCNPKALRIDGLNKLRRLINEGEAAGTGCMIVSAHLGSWEAVGWSVSQVSDSKFVALARRQRCKVLTRFLDKFRSRLGMDILLIDKPLLLREMVKTLRSGNHLGVVMDQRPAGGRKTPVEFMGRQTDFVCGPAIATQMTGCAVCGVFCVRKGPMHYELISSEIVPANHGIRDTQLLTQKMASAIEAVVDSYPEQWAWHYDRWRLSKACA